MTDWLQNVQLHYLLIIKEPLPPAMGTGATAMLTPDSNPFSKKSTNMIIIFTYCFQCIIYILKMM